MEYSIEVRPRVERSVAAFHASQFLLCLQPGVVMGMGSVRAMDAGCVHGGLPSALPARNEDLEKQSHDVRHDGAANEKMGWALGAASQGPVASRGRVAFVFPGLARQPFLVVLVWL